MAFKMKGHTLPGIKQRPSAKTAEGRAGSSAFQAKEKFKVSTHDRDFLSKKQNELIDKRIERQTRQDVDPGEGVKTDNYRTKDQDKNTLPSMNYDPKKDKFYASGSGTVNVKVKGKKKGISGPGESSLQDIKKVKLSKGRGKARTTTKIKYDKQGNVKKVVNRAGRFGLRKGTGVSLGEGESRVTGKKAAEKVLAKKTDNIIRGKRKSGDKKA